jgi:hypothetical protein
LQSYFDKLNGEDDYLVVEDAAFNKANQKPRIYLASEAPQSNGPSEYEN